MSDILHDKDIREPLFNYLEEVFGRVRIIEEKTMGKSRADILMVTKDMIYGIEIKSDADTYIRLKSQVKDYDKYFDRNIVVVGTSHALHIEEHVPSHWGIITVEVVDGILDFYMLRKTQDNPKDVLKNKLRILWRTELYELQMLNEMPKYKDKSKEFVIEKIIDRVPGKLSLKELNIQISRMLMERDYTTIKEELIEYRKGELQKKIEKEEDSKRKLELMLEKAEKGKNFGRYKNRRRGKH